MSAIAHVTRRNIFGRPLAVAIPTMTILRGTTGDVISDNVVLPGESIIAAAYCSQCDTDVDFTLQDMQQNVLGSGNDSCSRLASGHASWSFVAPQAEGTYTVRADYNKDWACLGIGGGGSDVLSFTVSARAGRPKPPPVEQGCGLLGLQCVGKEVQGILKWTAIAAVGVTGAVVAINLSKLRR